MRDRGDVVEMSSRYNMEMEMQDGRWDVMQDIDARRSKSLSKRGIGIQQCPHNEANTAQALLSDPGMMNG